MGQRGRDSNGSSTTGSQGMRDAVRTCGRDEFKVMRHRWVVDESVCNHLVGYWMAKEQAEYVSRGREVQLQVYTVWRQGRLLG